MSDEEKHEYVSRKLALNYHLMHPGGDSAPGDPNPAYCLDGTYHLHYILRHPWHGDQSVVLDRHGGKTFSFIHVTSPDMLHWTWQSTKLQPSYTGHGMFSGTGFITKEGKPAAIYAGLSEPRHSFIAVARDNSLNSWGKPFPVLPKGGPDGVDVGLLGDPDCFLVGDTYYAFSASDNVPLCKSTDLATWTYVGPLLKHEMPDVAIGEDISCANLFPIGGRWMLLCLSHPFGCRYYLGDWDPEAEQFVPDTHERMNWRRSNQDNAGDPYRDFFAPESVLTADGRRVIWTWLCTLDPPLNLKTIQSLPRELSLANDGSLRIRPLRELESLRYDAVTVNDVSTQSRFALSRLTRGGTLVHPIAELDGDAWEIRITVDRDQAERKRFGVWLFANGENEGLPVTIHPETGTIRLGASEAPFAVADLPEGEDIDLRIFIDKYLIEVFVCDRQAVLGTYTDTQAANGLYAYSWSTDTTFRSVEIWKLKPTNEGFFKAQANPIWEPDTE
jgi:beta-fructofuranosidase